MKSYKKVKLQDISKKIGSGMTPLRTNTEYWNSKDIPWVKTELLGQYIISETSEYISQQAFDENSLTLFPANTLSIAMYGEGKTRGNVSIFGIPMTSNQACCNLIIDEQKADYKYVYYALKSNYDNLRNLASGVRNNLNADLIKNFEIPLPNLQTQKNIADVLSCIDDKIALNNKTNTELENMAKTIYDYWFTQFDFPDKNGHPYKTSGGQMVCNEILKREIPAGWEVRRLGDVCEIVLGGTPSTDKDEYWNGNIPWLNSGEVAEFPIINAEKTVTELGIKDSATELVPAGTVTLSITRHLRPSILTMDACINQSVVGIKENELFSKNFLYPFIASKINHYMMLRTGAQQPHINKETVDDTLVCIPFAEVLENYNKEVGSIYERIILNAKETKQLTVLREYLLPLLMNGQIEVR